MCRSARMYIPSPLRFLRILYHLDDRDILRNIYEMSKHIVIIDTHIAWGQIIGPSTIAGIIRDAGCVSMLTTTPTKFVAAADPLSFWFTQDARVGRLSMSGSPRFASVMLLLNRPSRLV